ncbi:MAG: tRNA (N6-isopentenyl adenosine(37)-C2)-methylthiotransferase MiaB [Lachnospiraceae bacterium]
MKEMEIISSLKNKIRTIADEAGRDLYYYVETFGCQMNARDSEKLRGMLSEIGYLSADSEEEADFIVYNTCTVRENANQRIYGRLGYLHSLKNKKPHLFIALCGCMMQEDGEAEVIRTRYPFVDLVFGTYGLKDFYYLVDKALNSDRIIVDIKDKMTDIPEGLPTKRKHFFKSGINITYGCNNFCSYCIVPYVRGREISRTKEDILEEVGRLADDGVVEIMLLGQNVNSYGKNLENPVTFAQLLEEICKIDKIKRIRFMTSHPKDFSDELIDVIASNRKICRHIHLPVQSGSSRILKIMNRRYSREDYLELVERIRKKIPDISITTDIIVGFPSETEEDFNDTVSLVEKVGYDSAFTFIYSKRSGTPAAEMPDQISGDVVKERFDRLLSTVRQKAEKASSRFEGQILPVLVEEKNRMDGYVSGRLEYNIVVHFPGDADLIGKIVNVKLTQAKGFYYLGEQVQ